MDLNLRKACYILYIFTSPSAENKEKFVHLGDYFSLVALKAIPCIYVSLEARSQQFKCTLLIGSR